MRHAASGVGYGAGQRGLPQSVNLNLRGQKSSAPKMPTNIFKLYFNNAWARPFQPTTTHQPPGGVAVGEERRECEKVCADIYVCERA